MNHSVIFDNPMLRKIYDDIRLMQGGDAGDKLAEILHAKKEGVTLEESLQTAREITEAVNRFDALYEDARKDSRAALEKCLEALQPEEKIIFLRRARISLRALNDQALSGRLSGGETLDALGDDEFGKADQTERDTFIKESLEELCSMRFSDAAARRMLRAFEKNKDMLSTLGAITKEDFNLKCAAAMEVYLSGKDHVSVEDAASIACASAELQRVAEDLNRGRITAERAEKAVLALTIAGLILLSAALVHTNVLGIALGSSPFAFCAMILALIGAMALADEIAQHFPIWLGWQTVRAAELADELKARIDHEKLFGKRPIQEDSRTETESNPESKEKTAASTQEQEPSSGHNNRLANVESY